MLSSRPFFCSLQSAILDKRSCAARCNSLWLEHQLQHSAAPDPSRCPPPESQQRGHCCAMLWSLPSSNGLRLVTLLLFNALWTVSAFSFGSSQNGIRSVSAHVATRGFQSCCRGRPTRNSSRPQRMGLNMEQPYINESEVREEEYGYVMVSACARLGLAFAFFKPAQDYCCCVPRTQQYRAGIFSRCNHLSL